MKLNLGSSIYGKLEMSVRYSWRMNNDLEEVLKFVWSSFGLAFHIKKDVGLGLHHGVFLSQSYSAVIEMEPAAFVSCVCCVMSRTDPVKKGQMIKEKDYRSHTRICATI